MQRDPRYAMYAFFIFNVDKHLPRLVLCMLLYYVPAWLRSIQISGFKYSKRSKELFHRY